MKIITMLSVIGIISAVGIVASSSYIYQAFADANIGAPGQNSGTGHRNPSGDSPPPGQTHFPCPGNSGQCMKTGEFTHEQCFKKESK